MKIAAVAMSTSGAITSAVSPIDENSAIPICDGSPLIAENKPAPPATPRITTITIIHTTNIAARYSSPTMKSGMKRPPEKPSNSVPIVKRTALRERVAAERDAAAEHRREHRLGERPEDRDERRARSGSASSTTTRPIHVPGAAMNTCQPSLHQAAPWPAGERARLALAGARRHGAAGEVAAAAAAVSPVPVASSRRPSFVLRAKREKLTVSRASRVGGGRREAEAGTPGGRSEAARNARFGPTPGGPPERPVDRGGCAGGSRPHPARFRTLVPA